MNTLHNRRGDVSERTSLSTHNFIILVQIPNSHSLHGLKTVNSSVTEMEIAFAVVRLSNEEFE